MQEERAKKYAEGLSSLIKVKTVSKYNETDFSRFFDFHAVLERTFPKVFTSCEKEVFFGSLLLKWKGKSDRSPIMFMNHHDVVDGEGLWKYPAFSGEIAEGKVWGRGTLDTKGGLYCMLQAAEELIESGFVPENDIYFESACTEECEGSGAKLISEELLKRNIKFRFIIDEGGLIVYEPFSGAKGYFAMIGVGEKGNHVLKFTANSTGGHASAPDKNTPLIRLGRFMAEVDKSKIFKASLSPVVKEMLRRFSSKYDGGIKSIIKRPNLFSPIIKKVLSSLSGTSRAMLKTTVAFTMASGADSVNSIPQEAYVIGNMRFSHHQGDKSSVDAITALAKRYDIKTEIIDRGFESGLTNYKGEQFKFIERAIRETFDGVVPTPYIANAASDSRFMDKLTDNVIRFSPFTVSDQQLESIHGTNENIDISCLEKGVDFYKFLMEKK